MPLFPTINRKSPRLQGYDYGSNGAYFVTINTKNREHYFGSIKNEMMGLSEIGCRVWECWRKIPQHFPFVIIYEFVVMPDHMHGILFIDKDSENHSSVGTQDFVSLPVDGDYKNHFGPQSKNLASIVRGFKIGVTKYARKNDLEFAWQPRHNDRIIRNEEELNQIQKYIRHNPINWKKDKSQLY